MSLSYYPRNKNISIFNVNSSGGHVLAVIQKGVGGNALATHTEFWRVPYTSDNIKCIRNAYLLKNASDDLIRNLLLECRSYWNDHIDNMIDWIREWQYFLEDCGGYDESHTL